MVSDYQRTDREGADDFGLLAVPEDIRYGDPVSGATAARLLLTPCFYQGSTVVDLLRNITEYNTCVSVTASPDQRTVTLVADDRRTRSCKGWNRA